MSKQKMYRFTVSLVAYKDNAFTVCGKNEAEAKREAKKVQRLLLSKRGGDKVDLELTRQKQTFVRE